MATLNEKIIYRKAKKRAQMIRSFYINLMCYCIVIPTLIFINLYYSPEELWFYWSMVFWGMGLVFHGTSAFGWSPFLGKDWEERKIKELLEKQQHKDKHHI